MKTLVSLLACLFSLAVYAEAIPPYSGRKVPDPSSVISYKKYKVSAVGLNPNDARFTESLTARIPTSPIVEEGTVNPTLPNEAVVISCEQTWTGLVTLSAWDCVVYSTSWGCPSPPYDYDTNSSGFFFWVCAE
jgi:hypothetical protein